MKRMHFPNGKLRLTFSSVGIDEPPEQHSNNLSKGQENEIDLKDHCRVSGGAIHVRFCRDRITRGSGGRILRHQHLGNARLWFFEPGAMPGFGCRRWLHLRPRSVLHRCQHRHGLPAKAFKRTKRASCSEAIGSALIWSYRSPDSAVFGAGLQRPRHFFRNCRRVRRAD